MQLIPPPGAILDGNVKCQLFIHDRDTKTKEI